MATAAHNTTPALLSASADRYGDRIFIDDGVTQYSFSALQKAAHEVAAGLIGRGFARGDRAAIWAPNISDWVVAALGIHCAGGILVTLNTRYKADEAALILNEAGCTQLFSIGSFLGVDYPALLKQVSLPSLNNIFVLGAAADDSSAADTDSFTALINEGRNALLSDPALVVQRMADIDADCASDILFTSGTTGKPKGVVTAHGQNIRCFTQWSAELGLNESDRYLCINPFFHSFGYKAGWLACLMRGATILPHAVFDTSAILERIQRDRATVMPGPPTLFQSILSFAERENYDISSLCKVTTGAAVIPVELIRRMREDLKIQTILTAYGLTESCGLVSMCRQGDSNEVIANTSGRAIDGVELACMLPDGSLAGAGESGEVVVRGFNVMQGYFNNQDATDDTIDSAGWLHTGDIGVLDEHGNLRITDRLKDLYICGGFNCYPAEIENTLCTHPGIAMCAVIGIADERMGEVGMAWVVRNPGATLDEEALIAWCREHMANFKVPRAIAFVDALPTNASGKVLKTELRTLAANVQAH